jgi:Putative adhesin
MRFPPVRTAWTLSIVAALITLAGSPALAQDSEHDWQKDYPVSGPAALTIETSDGNLDIHSCGDCKQIRVRVTSGKKLSEFRLEEHQDRDHVYFLLREKTHIGLRIQWKSPATTVDVETPASLELDAHTSDGNLTARKLKGNLQFHSGDGNITLEDVHGGIHLTSSDGNINIHGATGTIEARASDGHMEIDGQFSGVQLHTSDGNLDFALADGSQLTAPSRIESSDGRVSIRVPQNLAADLDISSSDGGIDCALPLTMDHYDSHESSNHHIHGKLNSGGVALSVHTSDGSVKIANL